MHHNQPAMRDGKQDKKCVAAVNDAEYSSRPLLLETLACFVIGFSFLCPRSVYCTYGFFDTHEIERSVRVCAF